jgi:hypothetical protein
VKPVADALFPIADKVIAEGSSAIGSKDFTGKVVWAGGKDHRNVGAAAGRHGL